MLASWTVACRREPPPEAKRVVLKHAIVPATILGCYALLDHRGRSAAESLYWSPAMARLYTGGSAGKWTFEADTGVPATSPGNYNWAIDSVGDTLRLLFHSGFSGTEFILGVAGVGDTLRGRAVEHWDFGPPYETDGGRASAVRIACSGPPPRQSRLLPNER